MNTLVTKQMEMCIRVNENRQQFSLVEAEGLDGADLYDKLGLKVEDIRSSDYEQSRAQSSLREIANDVEEAREKLVEQMEGIRRTARITGLPGLENKFLPARGVRDQALLTLARTYGNDAFQIKAHLLRRGIGPDFINDLSEAAQAFGAALAEREKQLFQQKEATAELDGKIDEAMSIVRELGVIVRNVYAKDPAKLALWETVSHVEKPARRSRRDEDDAPQPSAPTQP